MKASEMGPAPLSVWIERRGRGEITDDEMKMILGIHPSQGGDDRDPFEPTEAEIEAGAKELYQFSQRSPTRPGHFDQLDPFYRDHYFDMARRVLIAARKVV